MIDDPLAKVSRVFGQGAMTRPRRYADRDAEGSRGVIRLPHLPGFSPHSKATTQAPKDQMLISGDSNAFRRHWAARRLPSRPFSFWARDPEHIILRKQVWLARKQAAPNHGSFSNLNCSAHQRVLPD